MASYLTPPVFAAFVWWFSTGAVLLLLGRAGRGHALSIICVTGLLLAGLCAVSVSTNGDSVSGAYLAFTGTILLWAAQEITFLAGWLTGPRPERCPPEASGIARLGFALQAILYHEAALLACGAAIAMLTWQGANQVALSTFVALWVLRQSAKINLFLGVPVTNDALLPEPVRFLKTYFAKKPVSAFFPLSVTLATAALVIMLRRLVDSAASPFEIAGLSLVSTLFALGIIEHWFMLLPLPAITLWGWGMRPRPTEDGTMPHGPDLKSDNTPPRLTAVVQAGGDISKSRPNARQRLEDDLRQRFLEQHRRGEGATSLSISSEPAASIHGRSS